ncbi:methyltransferase domain-containing protein [Kitasatospora sp. NBC_01287]|uniref:class I SAM-dependent methyltransferase n=1 Tax=Kitasatospora sp. NBC_01287 TaxID=2903573 RepID=UPI0022559F48|nr:methyltransferase domain-containing protein [Kitasatospora sp. NBC_01287]MCX4747631.1 methyltransferase domain-containing protein [Kitasatospora sp. NBC_01287]
MLAALAAGGGPGAPSSPDGPDGGDGAAGTAGYQDEAAALAEQYESVTFEQVHRGLLHLLPSAPARVLDLGAGSGRDAAALAALGHTVTAVEPTAALRELGERLHAGAGIRWLDDALPALPRLTAETARADGAETAASPAGQARFDLILVTAVWMHLAPAERAAAIGAVAALLAPGGTLLLTLRHGPVPARRRMFAVRPEEVLAQARAAGLRPVHQGERGDLHGRPDVRWTELGFGRAGHEAGRPR